jgi:hypothetical protein
VSRSPTRGHSDVVEGDRGYSPSRRSRRVARSPPPVLVGSTARSPQVIRTIRSHRSRSPTLVDPADPITIRVAPPSHTTTSAYEDPSHHGRRIPTDYSEEDAPRPDRRLGPSSMRRESEILPMRPPLGTQVHPGRGPPTVITLPGDRTHSPPSSPSPQIIQVPSSPRRGRTRIPSDGKLGRKYSQTVVAYNCFVQSRRGRIRGLWKGHLLQVRNKSIIQSIFIYHQLRSYWRVQNP